MSRIEYTIKIRVNDRLITKLIIDSHYMEKHADSINDSIIIDLVKSLDGKVYEAEAIEGGYEYYMEDMIELKGKYYKLIWLLENDELYIGVINAYRR